MVASMPFFAPSVNSYRRLVVHSDAPTNTHWGYDNRTTALRVPDSTPTSKRIENRVPGADANPYLAIAASLCMWIFGHDISVEAGVMRFPARPIVMRMDYH